jgi:uncharacterized protein (TIGR02996 family)
MTDEERAILSCVKDRPDDDMPRLAYADYLDGVGETARATFIRAQIAEARGGERNTHVPAYSWLPCVVTEVIWEWPFPEPNTEPWWPGVSLVWWHRGFAEGWVLTAADWLAFADAITAEHPVRRVRFLTSGGTFRIDRRDANGRPYYGISTDQDGLTARWTTADDIERVIRTTGSATPWLDALWPGITFELPPTA